MSRQAPYFTEAARAAAAQKRQERWATLHESFGKPEIYVVRAEEPKSGYVWEVRRYGGVTLARGHLTYTDPRAARRVGEAALGVLDL